MSTRAQMLKRRYGITETEWDEMLKAQGGKCPICLSVPKLLSPRFKVSRGFHVDHDHDTGAVRGLLCSPCNRTLERFSQNVERFLTYIGWEP